ncbi:MAG TPA: chemotaxis protein CheW [Polyangiaceae bacterium]|nr:chemotaxis protein CheW [Polyangiaceae bacterium]
MSNRPGLRVLVIRCGDSACALPLVGLNEVMRPLALEPSPRAPPFVLGMSMIRGTLVPVVDLALLVTGAPTARIGRYLTVSVGTRAVALAVSEVLGVHELARPSFSSLPPLLGSEKSPLVQAIATLDSQLLRVLREARAVGQELFALIESQELSA